MIKYLIVVKEQVKSTERLNLEHSLKTDINDIILETDVLCFIVIFNYYYYVRKVSYLLTPEGVMDNPEVPLLSPLIHKM